MWTSLGCLVVVVFVMAMLWKKDVEKNILYLGWYLRFESTPGMYLFALFVRAMGW